MHGWPVYLLLIFTALIAGLQNALAGGGSFITFPALLLFGMGARAANITSTIALFPGQIATGLAGRHQVSGAEGLSFRALVVLSLVGGVLGAVLLLATPESFFERLVPFLVLFATAVFAWGSFLRGTSEGTHLPPLGAAAAQFAIAIYGGYFGGGIGFSDDVHWLAALAVGIGAIAGGQIGAWMMLRVDERKLRVSVVVIGVLLTIGLFARSYG
jgi:uncharacterized membrane protein YfcA